MKSLCTALEEWKRVLGERYVITDNHMLAQAQTATFATTQRIPAILQPATREEVQACVRIANTYEVPLYPVSAGKNWGYGSQVPVQDGCVLLQLGRMNRILAFDERLAFITVEPGVTMRQAMQFLREHGSSLFLSIPGGTLDGSIIGNALERGLGSGRYADRFSAVCNFEVVLPTGECVQTGFDRFPHARTGAVARWSVGPYLDGIFTQSNMGIVTRMTVWLLPTPQSSGTCLFTIDDDSQLEEVIDALQRIKFLGECSSPIHLYNDYKVLSMSTQFPSEAHHEQTFLTPETMNSIRKALHLGAWNGLVTLRYGSRMLYQAMCSYIREQLEHKVSSLIFIDSDTSFPVPQEEERAYSLDLLAVRHTLGDIEKDGSIKTTYWRKKEPPPENMDPDRDRCGVIWCAPLVPFTGEHVRTVKEIIKHTCFTHHMEPHITITCINERSVIITTALLYDRDEPNVEEQAIRCHDVLLRRLTDNGYIPYRLGIQSMTALPTPADESHALLARIKDALDPRHILAPGRYEFSTSSAT